MAYNKNVWYGVRPKCEVSELIIVPVDIAHFSSALYALATGILLSVIVLAIEILTSRKEERRKQHVFLKFKN